VDGVTPDEDPIRARQKSRALVMALALAAFVILMFGITIVKMSVAP
jgi:hypothetical protein